MAAQRKGLAHSTATPLTSIQEECRPFDEVPLTTAREVGGQEAVTESQSAAVQEKLDQMGVGGYQV